ncbi:MAG: DNA mismatch repair endonuclease MutL [Lachnospiraceae bacterium]|nr:DNA mismatch repair endonuclease MutL [Lachnospiraceae bacterium]
MFQDLRGGLMPQIRILDEQTIDQIAAGEVIERPLSVVKELVENALDAGADQISVELLGGGIDQIRVTDNGCGIPADQVQIAFFRHATSKIESAEDLFALKSLGFRGEALSSIAAVAKVELVTRTKDSLAGFRYLIEGGVEMESGDVAAPLGTSFTVRDLFYNTPVRRKFLKSAQTETSYVVTLMEQLSLSRPGVAMRLSTDGKLRLQTSGSYGMKDIIYTLFGREVASHLRPVDLKTGDMELSGFVGEPSINRGNRGGELCFVNGRFVKNPMMMKAIEQAYHGLTMQHKFPVAVLQLTMDASQVDVNVHPQKTEVRFRSEKEVFDIIYRGVREALYAQDLIPAEETPAPAKKEEKSSSYVREEIDYRTVRDRRLFDTLFDREIARRREEDAEAAAVAERDKEQLRETEAQNAADVPEKPEESKEETEKTASPVTLPTPLIVETQQQTLFEEKIIQPKNLSSFRLLGQIFKTYWLIEYEGWFLIADQHAVHEKILYERTMRSLAKKEATSQMLLPPLILSLTGAQQETLERNAEAFEQLGFEISELGGREIRVDAVPGNLFSLSARDLFIEMLDEIGEQRATALSTIDAKVATMSCKAAVKGNDPLAFEEAEVLIRELLTLQNPYTCPHGRPTMIRMSRTELEKKFKRIV